MTNPIVAGLEKAAAALEVGDIERASAHMLEVDEACAKIKGEEGQLSLEELQRAKALFAACQLGVERNHGDLMASLLQSARLRNASRAYGPKK